MRRPRTFFLLPLLALVLTAGTAAARPPEKQAQAQPQAPTKRIVFPVVGRVQFSNDFGAPRGKSAHEGIDIFAPRKALVVAAEGGTVKFWTASATAGCMLYLDGDSGMTYVYLHLNDDLGAGNDNKGKCVAGTAYAKGLRSGDRVEAGEPIGYVGDSGDADGGATHIQFETRPKGGAPVNPYKKLLGATRLLFAARQGTTFTLALTGTVEAVTSGDVAVKVNRVRSWPGGRRVEVDGRTVAVAVPETATVESSFSAVGQLVAGVPVTVWTAPAPVTLAAQTGAAGALAASRVVVKN